MAPYLGGMYGNPSSLHRLGRMARSAIDSARGQVAELVDCLPEQVVFTSGGTEANALALHNAGERAFISAIEHPSVTENAMARAGVLHTLPVDAQGVLDFDVLPRAGINAGDFVSVMLANNETGAIQDIARLAEVTSARGAVLHTDAVQAAGKIPLSFRALGVQLMTLSSHKIYGPKGAGALISDWPSLRALQRGGDQERCLRAGTENVAAIVGFGCAAELARNELAARAKHLMALRLRLEAQLRLLPGLRIFAEETPRLPNTVQFGVGGFRGDMLLMQFDREGVAVSSGSACSAESREISPVLSAMRTPPELAQAAIRVSLGKDSAPEEVDRFVAVLRRLLGMAPA